MLRVQNVHTRCGADGRPRAHDLRGIGLQTACLRRDGRSII